MIMGGSGNDLPEMMNPLLLGWSLENLPPHLHEHLRIKPEQRFYHQLEQEIASAISELGVINQ